MKFFKPILAAFISSSLASPSPLTDVGSTSVKVVSDATNPNRFLVDVERTDLLDEAGETIAERLVAIEFVFDVQEDTLLINDKKVSSLGEGPKATVINATFVRGDVKDPEALSSYFSKGLVNVEVSSSVENFLVVDEQDPAGQPVLGRHISIHEKILEIDGNKLRQSTISEHVFDVYNNGTIVRSTTEPFLDRELSLEVPEGDAEVSPCDGSLSQSLEQLLDSTAWSVEDINAAALCGFSVVFALASLYFVVALVRRRRQKATYAPLSSDDCPPGYDVKAAVNFGSDLKPSPEVAEVAEA